MLVFIGFICILLLVVAHEAGHFFAARRSGVEVEEFGIGFPPKAKTITKKNGTEYTLNWLPLGGFVKLKGEHDADTTPGSFGAARLRDKVKVMVAGVGVNFLIAFLLFTFVSLIGIPQLVPNQFTVSGDEKIVRQELLIGGIAETSSLKDLGVEPTEKFLNIVDNSVMCNEESICKPKQNVNSLNELTGALEFFEGQPVTISTQNIETDEYRSYDVVLREKQVVEESRAARRACEKQKEQDESIKCEPALGYLGNSPSEIVNKRYTWAAPIVGAGTTVQFTQLTLEGLGNIVTGLFRGEVEQATEQVSGVVGVGFIFSSASFLGPVFMLMIVAVISLSLAIMNTLPIPALDGGRLFVTLLFRAMNKPLTKETEEKIHGSGFAALMILFVLITIVDVQRFIL